jgi:hypothetical protein
VHFFGLFHSKKGYKCYDPINKKFYISRNIKFQENEPFYKEKLKEIYDQEPSNMIPFIQEPKNSVEILQEEQEVENEQQQGNF